MTRAEKIGRIMREVKRRDEERAAARRPKERYVVTELEGDLTPRQSSKEERDRTVPGLSCHVVDTLVNRRLMATYRSEDYGGVPAHHARAKTRRLAAEHAHRLSHPVVAACAYCGNPIHPNAWPKACRWCADLPGLEPL